MPEVSRIKEHLKTEDMIKQDKIILMAFLICAMVEPQVKFYFLYCNIILDHADQAFHCRSIS